MAYGSYRGQCVGRALRFLYDYNSVLAETCIFHPDGKITQGQDGPVVVSETVWNNDGDGDVPTFVFAPNFGFMKQAQDERKSRIIEYEKLTNREQYSRKAEIEFREAEIKARREKLFSSILEARK